MRPLPHPSTRSPRATTRRTGRAVRDRLPVPTRALSRRGGALLVGAVLAATLTGCAGSAEALADRLIEQVRSGAAAETGTVSKIVDGDTLDVTSNGTTQRIRVLGINTPERGECGYREATDAARRFVPVGSVVALEREPGGDDVDRYGRALRYVYADGRPGPDLSSVQVGAGWALVYERYPVSRTPGLLDEQASAQARRLGVWGKCR